MLRLAETGRKQGKARFPLERNPALDPSLGLATYQPPGFTWPALGLVSQGPGGEYLVKGGVPFPMTLSGKPSPES